MEYKALIGVRSGHRLSGFKSECTRP